MKDRADLETRLKAELEQWLEKQIRNEYADFYLYYLPTTAEHDGGILIARDRPANPEYKLAMSERINKGLSINQNFNRIRNSGLYNLPVLSY